MFTSRVPTEHDLVRRVVEHVTAHPGEPADVTTLAAVAGVTPRHLGRVFLAQVGQTPGRYVRRLRTDAAAHVLATTALNSSAVAARCD